MSADDLHWLMQWYLDQCDGDWEHSFGIDIGTLDNPGWRLKIDLRNTALEDRPFTKVERGEAADDLEEWKQTGSWWVIEVKNGAFDAACGPLDLPAVLALFRQWAESPLEM